MAAPLPALPAPRRSRPAALRLLTASVCLSAALALSACGPTGSSGSSGSSSASASASHGGVTLAERTGAAEDSGSTSTAESRPTTQEPTEPATSAAPSPTASATWSTPSIKFYNEDTSIWYQDDNVVNLDSVSSDGNIEGYRTNNNACFGFVTRETSQRVWSQRGNDDLSSSILIERKQQVLSDYNAQGAVAVDLVRDDGGTMQGYELAFSATMNYVDAPAEPVEGYRFARTVGDSGFQFEVMVLCQSGRNLSVDQWHTLLGGLRLEGLDAQAM